MRWAIAARSSFYMEADSLTGNEGWAMQLNPGSGFTTRLSELTASNHTFQLYTYNLQPGDLVSNLILRFQFSGGSSSNRIQLDDISLTIVTGTTNSTNSAGFIYREIRPHPRRQFRHGRPL